MKASGIGGFRRLYHWRVVLRTERIGFIID